MWNRRKMYRLRMIFAAATIAVCATVGVAVSQQTLTYGYDELGRISSVTYPDGKQIIYRYDAAGNSTQDIISATIVNRPPVAADDAKSANEGAVFVFDPRINDSDPDGNNLTITHKTDGQAGTVAIVGGNSLSYTPTNNQVGTDTFVYTISDGNQGSDSAKVTMTLVNLNPTANPDAVSVAVNGNVTFDPRTNDTDPGNDPLTITGVTNGTKGVLTLLGPTSVKYTPYLTYSGVDHPTYTISDGEGGTAVGTLNVTIGAGNVAPSAVNDSYNVTKNVARTMYPMDNDSDPNFDPFTITGSTNGSKGSVAVNGGASVTYTPNLNATGADSFTYTVTDSEGAPATATVNVNIQLSNTAPVASTDYLYIEGVPTFIGTIDPRWNDSDANGDSLRITGVADGPYATVTIMGNGTYVQYVRNSNKPTSSNPTKTDSFTYTITDDRGGNATGTVNVTMQYIGCPPTCQ